MDTPASANVAPLPTRAAYLAAPAAASAPAAGVAGQRPNEAERSPVKERVR